ncbi:MAG: cytochrome c [Flavobacteriales bacterium]|nr:cytochrome c [Flavobacteriales bacterium]MBP9079385.1 cytochrome c [Flavobacteriales bacterium]
MIHLLLGGLRGATAMGMVIFCLASCKHEPVVAPDGGLEGQGPGPGPLPIMECDPDSVYFEQQILPLLISNCAVSGCHDQATNDNDGIQLTSYSTLMASGTIQDGDLWEAINEDDPDKLMPRPPQAPLSADQITLIGQWIQQGFQDNACENSCDTLNVTYSGVIQPLVDGYCTGCHGGSSPEGGLDYTTWDDLHAVAVDGRLAGSIQHQNPFTPMPPTGPMLPDCQIDQIMAWIAQGAPNN